MLEAAAADTGRDESTITSESKQLNSLLDFFFILDLPFILIGQGTENFCSLRQKLVGKMVANIYPILEMRICA